MATALGALAVWLLAGAGSPTRPTVTAPPVWIAGGATIAFRADDGRGELWYTLDPDGGEPEPFYPVPRYDRADLAWWSPAGDRLAYLGYDDGDPMIFMASVDEPVGRIHAATGGIERPLVAWAPDGRRLAVARAVPNGRLPYELSVTGIGGGGATAHVFAHSPPSQAVWNRESTRLAYVAEFQGADHLFVALLDERTAALCSPNVRVVPGTVAWHPSGRRLTMVGNTNLALGPKLWVTRADGRLPADELNTGGFSPAEPILWRPDGEQVVWRAGTRGNPDGATLYVADAEDLSSGRPFFDRRGFVADPTYSPDSRLLACTWREPRAGALATVMIRPCDGEGGPEQRIERAEGVSTPVFSPDGKRVAVLVGPPEARRVEVIRLEAELLPGD